jgi:hypothetical protein
LREFPFSLDRLLSFGVAPEIGWMYVRNLGLLLYLWGYSYCEVYTVYLTDVNNLI